MLLGFLCLDVLGDVIYTLYHYAAHKLPFLWKYHKVHHEKTRPNARDTFHMHAVDLAASTLARIVAPLALVGARLSWPPILAFMLFSAIVGVAHHSDTALAHWASCGFVPGRVHASYHLTHHKRPGVNFGGAYWLWDAVLGKAVFNEHKADVHDLEMELRAWGLEPG